ncbi:PLP-dependent aminotransferase family protein [Paenibacillus sp. GCM10023248]|uniref:aminotransferase-like domain-containing protein n=1 Tax=Bacillales TaxID=1385 RepID=UPI0023785E4E|nr:MULTISPECIES: PLP-dependent aminotransferase family protein [Bacillales]MDD9266440.1 PLP-dependent aminotransferase family protein [Paenibacillus sp. MAHUQ-63]MDR6878565.1 2-aminoadipate transaminase [Bacillus sp. 3255]
MKYRFSKSLEGFSSSAVREILKLTQGSSIISFAGGLPAEEFFPLDAVSDAFKRVIGGGKSALQYGLTEGYKPLRESLCKRMAAKNMQVTPDQMLLTTGSQQAIDLLTRVYIDEGDIILVERPTYLAAIQVFQAKGAKIISVESDNDGMILEDLAAKVAQHNPKLVYVIPTFSNPAGRVWSLERRQGLLNICREADVLILEDDPYGEIQFDGDATYPSVFSLGGAAEGGNVVYTSTFSKTVAPAFRTGWVMGDEEIIRQLARFKQSADLHSSTIDQQTLYHLLEHFDLDAHIALIREQYQDRMTFMSGLLKELNWPGLKWEDPKGGMFIWVELPEHIRAEELLKIAVKEGVAFVPGSTFYAENPQYNTMRLNYTHTDRENTILGMQRLAKAMESYLQSV